MVNIWSQSESAFTLLSLPWKRPYIFYILQDRTCVRKAIALLIIQEQLASH